MSATQATVTSTQVAVRYRIGGMSVAYRLTCRPIAGQQLSVDITTDISIDISADISTDTRPICRSICPPTHLDRYIGQVSVNMSTDISVEGCTKYTWSRGAIILRGNCTQSTLVS